MQTSPKLVANWSLCGSVNFEGEKNLQIDISLQAKSVANKPSIN